MSDETTDEIERARRMVARVAAGPWRGLPNGVFGGDPERRLLTGGTYADRHGVAFVRNTYEPLLDVLVAAAGCIDQDGEWVSSDEGDEAIYMAVTKALSAIRTALPEKEPG